MTRMLPLWVAGLGLVLLACAAPQSVPAPAGGEADAPKFGGVLNTVGEDFTDFDMSYNKTVGNIQYHALSYDGLLAFKKGPEVEYVSQILEPALAERWEVSSDARTFSYYLRKGVKFADVAPVNGRELTAEDVKWSLEYYSRTGEFGGKKLPVSQMEPLFEGLESIEAPNRYTVRVRFKEPFAPFLNYTASQWMPIAAPEVYKQDANPPRLTTLVGTGPYIYDAANSQKDNRFVFTKNPSYWGAPKPYLDAIRRLIIPDQSTRQAAFQVKQIDILAPPDYRAAQEIKKNNPQALMSEDFDPYAWSLFLSQKRGGALTDIRVRRAVSLALDRDEFNQVTNGGKGAWALTASWPGLFSDTEAHELQKYDPEQAKRLLAEAGYAGGLKLEYMVLATKPDAAYELVQAQLKRVGIDAPFLILPREQNRPRTYAGDYDIVKIGSSGADADFDGIHFSYHSSSPQNWAHIKDPELDKLIVAQRREMDPQKRREAQRAVVRRIHDMVWNPAYIFPVKVWFWHPYVKNHGPHFTVGEHEAFVWLDK